MIIMDGFEGLTIDLETGYKTNWHDDLGENNIEDIVFNWLKYQSYIGIEVGDSNYTGHQWWTQEPAITPEDRLAELPNMIFNVY